MPSYLDLGVLGVVFVSALLSMLRGFTREILAIGSWAAAAAAAYYFYPYVLPLSHALHQQADGAQAAAAAVVFFVTLIMVSLFTVRVSDAILDSKIGALDRSLGFVFGAARGFLLAVVAFWIFNWLVGDKQQPEWVQERQDPASPDGDRRPHHRDVAGGRGDDARRLDQVQDLRRSATKSRRTKPKPTRAADDLADADAGPPRLR